MRKLLSFLLLMVVAVPLSGQGGPPPPGDPWWRTKTGQAFLANNPAFCGDDQPTTNERLRELTGLTEEFTTGGDRELSLDQAYDIHEWLDWQQTHKPCNETGN